MELGFLTERTVVVEAMVTARSTVAEGPGGFTHVTAMSSQWKRQGQLGVNMEIAFARGPAAEGSELPGEPLFCWITSLFFLMGWGRGLLHRPLVCGSCRPVHRGRPCLCSARFRAVFVVSFDEQSSFLIWPDSSSAFLVATAFFSSGFGVFSGEIVNIHVA